VARTGVGVGTGVGGTGVGVGVVQAARTAISATASSDARFTGCFVVYLPKLVGWLDPVEADQSASAGHCGPTFAGNAAVRQAKCLHPWRDSPGPSKLPAHAKAGTIKLLINDTAGIQLGGPGNRGVPIIDYTTA